MRPLTEWLQLMLGEIQRKREEVECARDEEARRASECEAQRQAAEPHSPAARGEQRR